MTATPEERAFRITDAILDLVVVDGENVSASVLHPATDLIAQAIREAEDAALEIAALSAEKAYGGSAHTYASENADIYRAQDRACEVIANCIRALKHNKD